MRIVGGEWRGRPVEPPRGRDVSRPTTDRVREAIASMLESALQDRHRGVSRTRCVRRVGCARHGDALAGLRTRDVLRSRPRRVFAGEAQLGQVGVRPLPLRCGVRGRPARGPSRSGAGRSVRCRLDRPALRPRRAARCRARAGPCMPRSARRRRHRDVRAHILHARSRARGVRPREGEALWPDVRRFAEARVRLIWLSR